MQNIEQTISAVSTMSISDRLRLAEAIWDSLDDASTALLTPQQHAELKRRMMEHETNPGSAMTREEVEQRLAELRCNPQMSVNCLIL
ncbi:addiction module component, TIGR02574 family [Pirellula staleyi DSM 6068]|uniref:Addiction module component, TIGR02574 family n=1 Tax=Pirellula staleyi (strain ATCC 27377 / DSM 6068 / ICPB 4128) TaxID=530564 RepID=D2R3N2_PIRSD|nr:addiction module protein [Pirellula staleyi]ADB16986.1 addiction module component, TIGR02574 family [Pirellula staleyi DSM 6068]